MAEVRSKLVIIGNGFDLAHGFKTSYNDFLYWYLSNFIKNYLKQRIDADNLITITPNNNIYLLNLNGDNDDKKVRLSNLEECHIFFNKYVTTKYTSRFLQRLINSNKQYSWIDIENEYYQSVISMYNLLTDVNNLNNRDYYKSLLTNLNNEFEFLRDKLEEYLIEIQQNVIKDHLPNANGKINKIFQHIFSKISDSNKYVGKTPAKVVLLNFNYTNTIEKYIGSYSSKNELIYIHGKLSDKVNPIIFGFGDETDEYYEKIENLKINDFLNNFKSFWYFKTDNYQRLLKLIDEQPYDIEILGHSCGLSDRVLLSTIFQHDNCKSIKIHYHAKSETENDFFSKTQEISRHFRDKAKMRRLIVNFRDCDSIN
jgi:Bacteriophage abortive infection AbiH